MTNSFKRIKESNKNIIELSPISEYKKSAVSKRFSAIGDAIDFFQEEMYFSLWII